MEPQFGFWFERLTHRVQTHFHIVRQHITRRIGDINTVRAVAFHQFCLLDQTFRRIHVRHHQEANGIHIELTRHGDVLLGYVRFGTVRCHADGVHAQILGHAQMIDGTNARQQQRGHFRVFHQRNHGGQIFFVAVRRKTVVHRATAQTIAMRHFDQRHARFVQADGDVFHLLQRHLVAFRMHPVTQGHVVNGDFFTF